MAGKPELYSVWEDSAGARLIFVAVDGGDEEDPDFWLATAVAYEDRFDASASALELDPDEWAELASVEKMKQVGVEPGEYPI
ncbi:hypothetical protein [Cupriavidus oxalaticus]|uniref:hypothetical protein n=1 Tax=Cupriavidus oxalaticus TaxID=96344 RepID=UPI004033539A